MAKNLFEKSKTKEEIRKVTIEDEKFFSDVKKLEYIKDEIKEKEKDSKKITSYLKEVSLNKWLELYKDERGNPGTVIFESVHEEEIANLMFVPSDRYIKVNEKSAKSLKETYGEDVIEEEVKFSFNQEMVEKYGSIISDFIQQSDDIEDDDKDKIIEAVKLYSVKKGVIDELDEYGDVKKVFDSVKPVVSMKDIKIIKS